MKIWLLVGALLLGSCRAIESSQLKVCEGELLAELKSPSSYKRVSASEIVLDAGEPPHYYLVTIDYDAANSFGAMLRGHKNCSFRLKNGKPTLEQFDPYAADVGASVDAATAAVDAALDAAVPESAGNKTDESDAPDESPAPTAVAAPEQYPGKCYKDYCPCDPPQGGPDQLLCDQLEEGLDVDVQLMIAGRGMREARRQMDTGDY